jgi:hypothetical protein
MLRTLHEVARAYSNGEFDLINESDDSSSESNSSEFNWSQ